MRIRLYSLVLAVVVLAACGTAAGGAGASAGSREYDIKAAFLYNFLKFAEWPKDKTDGAKSIVIGVIGTAPMKKAFEPIVKKGAEVDGRPISLVYFKSYEALVQSAGGEGEKRDTVKAALRACHLLFICASEDKHTEEILEAIEGVPVLTVGERRGFLEAGGIINFVLDDEKVRFEINAAAAKQAYLKIRSQLLRLAQRVIENGKEANDKSSGRSNP